MNVATYGFTMLAARIIGPSQYGAFAASAWSSSSRSEPSDSRRRGPPHRGAPRQRRCHREAILALTAKVAAGLGILMLLLAPAVNLLLNFDNLVTAAVAVSVVPLTWAGGQVGILQGERRWGALAVFYLAGGIPRLIVGTSIILWTPSATPASTRRA